MRPGLLQSIQLAASVRGDQLLQSMVVDSAGTNGLVLLRDQWISFARRLLGLRRPTRRGKAHRTPCFELSVPMETPQRASALERWTNERFPTPSVAVSPLEARVALSPRVTTQGTQTYITLTTHDITYGLPLGW